MKAPAGVTITEYAKVPGARAMLVGTDGSVYVSLPQRNEIVRLVDANRDGVAESQDVAVTGLNRPHGMALRDGWLYIANTGGHMPRETLSALRKKVPQTKPYLMYGLTEAFRST